MGHDTKRIREWYLWGNNSESRFSRVKAHVRELGYSFNPTGKEPLHAGPQPIPPLTCALSFWCIISKLTLAPKWEPRDNRGIAAYWQRKMSPQLKVGL
jgi:hypothetical protein